VLPAETILIAGPTGAGKTDLSLRLAECLGGEIIGADAFQIYAGLPLLSAQPNPCDLARIPHHLVASIPISEAFDTGRYREAALEAARDIAKKGKRPIVTGGTGLYFRALLGGLDELPPRDPNLREELSALSPAALEERLRQLDPVGVATVDLANRRRVERALEIILLTGKPLAESRKGTPPPPPGVRGLLLTRERTVLNGRIAANVERMFSRGVEEEVSSLPEGRIGPTASATLGLREIRSLLRGEASREETVAAITLATRRYAKRQMTWFRNQHGFPELDPDRCSGPDDTLERARAILGVT
jgi:tRNA dimethylallyltransferase